MDHKTNQSRKRYNLLAQSYEDSFDGRFTQPYNRYLCDYLTLADNDSVLDVACGNGRLLRMLSQKAHINAYGTDISEEMIAAAQTNNKDAVFSISPADNTAFSDCMFDIVTVCCAFHHFSNPDSFMKEAYRVLKTNGKLVIADPSPISVIRWIDNLIIPFMRAGDVKIYRVAELYDFFNNSGFYSVSHRKSGSMLIIEGVKK